MRGEKKKLTAKQKRFVEEYCVDFNATQAAIRAGYSVNTARQQGQRLLTYVDIKKAIDERIEKRKEKLEITEKDIITELAKIGFSNVANYYDPDFKLKDITKLNSDMTAAIKEVVRNDTVKGTKVAIKFYSKEQALELLGRHLGMWKTDQADKDWYVIVDYVTKRKAK